MPSHDRRPQAKAVDERFQNARYRSLWQSDGFETLKSLVDQLVAKWQVEPGTGETLDAYAMGSLRRDGRIEGVKTLLREVERLANASEDG